MEYFLLLLLFSFVVYTSFIVKDSPAVRIFYYFLALVVAILMGLRGVEIEYSPLYESIPPLSEFLREMSPVAITRGYLFALTCSLLKTCGLGVQSLLLLFAIVSISLHAIFYRLFSPYYFLAFLIYLAHEIAFKEWFTIRAGLSSALVLPTIYYLVRKQNKPFLLLVVISGLIQYVGFLSIFLRWLDREIKSRHLIAGLIVASGVALLNLTRTILQFLGDLGVFPDFISIYFRFEAYAYDMGLGHVKLVQQAGTILLVIFLRSRMPPHPSPYYNLIFNTYYLSTVLFILFSDMAIFATRFGGHFYVVEPILLTLLAYYFVEKKGYACLPALGALLIGFINYVIKIKLPPYKMFVDY